MLQGGNMLKPIILASAAGILFSLGCEKKSPEKNLAFLEKRVPEQAPPVSMGPGTVYDHLRYAVIRKDLKHLESFCPEDQNLLLGTATMFHRNAGYYGFHINADEIATLGAQNLLKAGYISDKWSIRDVKDAHEGKRDAEPGMERVNEAKLDMPILPADMNKKTRDTLLEELKKEVEKNPKAAYASGLYRILKTIPEPGWLLFTSIIATNPNPGYDDVLLKLEDKLIVTLTIGKKADGSSWLANFQFAQGVGPKWLANHFAKTHEEQK
jgi:hypothetical protein